MLTSSKTVEHNRQGWDRLVVAAHTLTKPVTADELKRARSILDPVGWLDEYAKGQNVLCLAAGGGRFSALFAALEAKVTVVDISPAMLAHDRRLADEFGFSIRIIQADMCSMPMLEDAEFDLIMQPVSTTYLEDPRFAFAEVARIAKPNSVYVSFHKQPTNLQSSLHPHQHGYSVERPVGAILHNPIELQTRFREAGTIEHAHSLQVLLGGICKSGFMIEDIVEPNYADLNDTPGSFHHRCAYIPPYIAVKARRMGSQPSSNAKHSPKLIIE